MTRLSNADTEEAQMKKVKNAQEFAFVCLVDVGDSEHDAVLREQAVGQRLLPRGEHQVAALEERRTH